MWRAGSTPRKLPTTRSARQRRKNFFANRVGELYRVRVSANDSDTPYFGTVSLTDAAARQGKRHKSRPRVRASLSSRSVNEFRPGARAE